jgi:hypothetical protein
LVPAANVKKARLAEPKGQSPLVYITSGSTQRPPLTVRQKMAQFTIVVYSLVILYDPQNPKWTEEMAEDLVDDIEAGVKDAVENNPKQQGLWTSLEYIESGTLVERAPLGGNDYLVEMIPLLFKNSF